MGGRQAGSTNRTRVDIETGLRAWIRLGTAEAAAAETGMPASSLRSFKCRHPDTWDKLGRVFGEELREKRRAVAAEVIEGIREGILVCRQALRTSPDGKETASLIRAMASVDSNLDRFARLDAGNPTDIVEDRRSDSDLIVEIERALQDPALRTAFEEHRQAVP